MVVRTRAVGARGESDTHDWRCLGRFLAAPELPVGDWTQVKEELETLYERELGAPE